MWIWIITTTGAHSGTFKQGLRVRISTNDGNLSQVCCNVKHKESGTI